MLGLVADSFEGARPLAAFAENVVAERGAGKLDSATVAFYQQMYGSDWEQVIDNDTEAIAEHAKQGNGFFRWPLTALTAPILLTGSSQDEFVKAIDTAYF